MKRIPITQGMFVLVDDADYDFVMLSKWSFYRKADKNTGYAIGWRNGKNISMHRALMGAKPGQVVDHLNHDGLDNRRGNMRIVSDTENKRNRRGVAKHSTTGVRGVRKTKCGYFATIGVYGRAVYLGHYKKIEEAAAAYAAANVKYFGKHGGVF